MERNEFWSNVSSFLSGSSQNVFIDPSFSPHCEISELFEMKNVALSDEQFISIERVSLDTLSCFSLPSKLSLLTFNVWFDPFETEKRCIALLHSICTANPSCVALQEVTPSFLQIIFRILSHPTCAEECFIKNVLCWNYYISSHLLQQNQDSFSGLCFLIAKQLPIIKLESWFLCHATASAKKLMLVAHLKQSVAICNVHLEMVEKMPIIRQHQLHFVHSLMQNKSHVFVLGDFNCEQPVHSLLHGYKDVWNELKKSETEGYTYDTIKNDMLARRKQRTVQLRLDRILYRSNDNLDLECKPTQIKLSGDSSIDRNLFMSDHFGVEASFILIDCL